MKDVLNFTDSELSSQFCARAKPQVVTQSRNNCAIIAPSRARAWFEKKYFIDYLWNSLFIDQSECLLLYLFCIQLPLFCAVLRKNCTVLSQSESSIFFLYIINWVISRRVNGIKKWIGTVWFFRLRFCRANDSVYDSDLRFSLGH